jgi:hypothetical protein
MKRKLIAVALIVVFLFTAGIPASADSVVKASPVATSYNNPLTSKLEEFNAAGYAVLNVAHDYRWHNIAASVVIAKSKKGKYVASRKSYAFHYTWCRYVKQIKSENLVYYSSKKKAKADGKRPCKVCMN